MKAKKIIAIVLAMMLAFALAAPSFAMSDSSASYTQVALANAPTITGTFTIYLSIDSSYISNNYTEDDYEIHRYRLPVTMGADGVTKTYYVSDVLDEAMNDYPALSFTDSSGVEITETSGYVYGVIDSDVDSTISFHPLTSINYRNGWMFRIDGKYPLLNSANWPDGWTSTDGPCGAAINQAYLTESGQTVEFYFADTSSSALATKTVCVDSHSYNASTKKLTLTFYQSNSWYNSPSNYWNINNYSALESSSVWVKIDNGYRRTLTTDSNGQVTISNVTLSSGSHTITIVPQYNTYLIGSYTYGILKNVQLVKYTFTVS